MTPAKQLWWSGLFSLLAVAGAVSIIVGFSLALKFHQPAWLNLSGGGAAAAGFFGLMAYGISRRDMLDPDWR